MHFIWLQDITCKICVLEENLPSVVYKGQDNRELGEV